MSDLQTKRRRGCLFYGCLTGCVLLIFMLMGLLLGLRHFKKMVNDFTDSQPTSLPAVEYSPAQIQELDQRIAAFQSAVEAHRSTVPLALSADDLNALVAAKPEARSVRGKLHLVIDQDQLKTQVSLPLAELGLPFFKGRYLNGTANLLVAVQQGKLTVVAQGISSKGNSLPSVYEERIRQQNLAAKLNLDQRVSTALGLIQGVEVKGGKLFILPKAATPVP